MRENSLIAIYNLQFFMCVIIGTSSKTQIIIIRVANQCDLANFTVFENHSIKSHFVTWILIWISHFDFRNFEFSRQKWKKNYISLRFKFDPPRLKMVPCRRKLRSLVKIYSTKHLSFSIFEIWHFNHRRIILNFWLTFAAKIRMLIQGWEFWCSKREC